MTLEDTKTRWYKKNMFNRPRCRDWTALATQQLRLRSLIRIIGHNILCSSPCCLYFTLHSTAMSAPFYTSEKVDPHGTGTVEWPEINSGIVLKSTARCICIRVWEQCYESDAQCEQTNPVDSNRCSNSSSSGDKMLFIWGVYFSGLIPITKRSDLKFLQNSLAFQMNGGYFASAESLALETIRKQLTFNYEHEKGANIIDVKKDSERDSKRAAIPVSASSIDTIKPSQKHESSPKEFEINSPRNSRNCSPERDEGSCHISSSDVSKDMKQMLKTRYLEKQFLNSEIRSSYNLDRLLNLQEKQRKYKQKNEHAKEISERICMKSAFCLNLELISSKGNWYQPKGNPSMGRTLNRLLFQDSRVKPEDLLKAQEFRRQIEISRFKCQLLSQERNKMRSEFRKLEKKLGELHDNIVEQESLLMSCYRNLSREKEVLAREKTSVVHQNELLNRAQTALRQRRFQLCRELQSIYHIEETTNGQFSINKIVLPSTEFLSCDSKITSSNYQGEPVSPLSLSVALGYVAHIVYMVSVIYNVPLRNPIKHEGSRSRIVDNVKDLPNSSKEFPLFCRSNPLPKPVFYAIYLLNQNIAQLNYHIHRIKSDLRETLLNLLTLISDVSPNTPEIGDDITSEGQHLCISGSSADLHVPVPTITKAVDMLSKNGNGDRLSRSVGSYSDQQISSSSKNFYNSEPLLAVQHHVRVSEFSDNCNI